MTPLGYIESERVIVLDEPEYTASYHTADLGDGRVMTFAHLEVFYYSPSILKKLKREWDLFRKYEPCVMFALSDTDDEKWVRFISMFGFQYLRDVGCTDGRTRRLFVNFGPTHREAQEK
jgi:hypothetical protein